MKQEEKNYLMNLKLLKDCIGRNHCIAQASGNFMSKEKRDKDYTVYQVMPDALEDYPFFDWYCEKFEDKQYFENIHECVTTYLFYRNRWIDEGCPKVYSYE